MDGMLITFGLVYKLLKALRPWRKRRKGEKSWSVKPVIFPPYTSMFWFECIQNNSVGWNQPRGQYKLRGGPQSTEGKRQP